MDTEIKNRKTEIKNGAKYTFLFVLLAILVPQILAVILPFLPSQICSIIGMLLGTVIVLCGKCKPEKGTLLADKGKLSGTGFLVLLGAFMLAKLLSMLLGVLVGLLFINNDNASTMLEVTSMTDNLFLYFLFLGIVTPICEEIVFRGCIGNSYKKHGIRFAMIMSSLLFAMYHGNILQLFSTFLPGIVLFYAAMNYSIKWSILLHFINNAVLTFGGLVLDKVFPGSPVAEYGEYVIEAVLVIIALVLWKKDCASEKVKSFLSGPENEKGAYKAAIGNFWFILMLLVLVLTTAATIFMLSGKLPELPAVG